jgi:hypothetical protein
MLAWPSREQWKEDGTLKTAISLAAFWSIFGPIIGPVFLYRYTEGRVSEWWRHNYSDYGRREKEQQ